MIMCVLQYVDEVLIGAPYDVTEDLMNHYNIHMVVHGSTPIKTNPDGTDPFAVGNTVHAGSPPVKDLNVVTIASRKFSVSSFHISQ